MKLTISAIKADVGAIGGHIRPSRLQLERADSVLHDGMAAGTILDYYITYVGDDIGLLMTHGRGRNNPEVHGLAYRAFQAGTAAAEEQGLYAAGQDLLVDSFSGNVRGMGPGVAELEFEERPGEPFLYFQADKCGPGALSLPLYDIFCNPRAGTGLIGLSPAMRAGYRFDIMDMNFTEGDRLISLDVPERHLDVAALLRDEDHFGVEGVYSRTNGQQVVAASTTRLHNISGKYSGKDDPVMLVRAQKDFPATEEICTPFAGLPIVTGDTRGSHRGHLTPVLTETGASSYFCQPIIAGLAFCVRGGMLTEPAELFEGVPWDHLRLEASRRFLELRSQGFFGAAMASAEEIEYTALKDHIRRLEEEFTVRRADQLKPE